MLDKKNIIQHLLIVHDYLTSLGKFYGFIRTQTNNPSLPEIAFLNIYSHIYESIPQNVQQTLKKEDYPSIMNLKSKYLTDHELKETIWSRGFHIISYKNKIYESVIQDKSQYKQGLKAAFINNVRNFQLSEKKIKQLSTQFVKNIIKQSKKNNLGQLIESWNFTKIKLSKKENPRPPIYINDSLLAEDYSKL